MCGDSTNIEHVAQLTQGQTAHLIHADPPYGMGKQKDGVANDNLYGKNLDAFQMQWWEAWHPFLKANGSAYVWGNAPDLWRLWYVGGLKAFGGLNLRNEIVWDKKTAPGMRSHLMTQYVEATERCLFLQQGEQFLGSVNSCDYWEGWEPVRGYLSNEAAAVGLTPQFARLITGVQMFSHWFSKSQWSLISAKHYAMFQAAFPGHFLRPHDQIKTEHAALRREYKAFLQSENGRSFFNNTHEVMHDVWSHPRVVGEERYGHATPKPVEMMRRALRSSTPENGTVLEPFAGSGSTLIAAEHEGRACYTMELKPEYVDVTLLRWMKLTGETPEREA